MTYPLWLMHHSHIDALPNDAKIFGKPRSIVKVIETIHSDVDFVNVLADDSIPDSPTSDPFVSFIIHKNDAMVIYATWRNKIWKILESTDPRLQAARLFRTNKPT